MNTLNKNAAGIAAGTVAALLHALMAVGVWVSLPIMQKLINFNLALHFMQMDVVVQPFSWGGTITLVLVGFFVGYVVGYLFACVYNWKTKGRN